MEKNIVLIGFMGSGKTSVGKKLSMDLKREFIDMDDFIVNKEGMSINDIFKKKGEAYFRSLEKELCKRFADPKSKIIATGGGVIKNDENVANLKKGGIILYLKSTPKQIAYNLRFDNTRPLLAGSGKEEKIARLLEEREPAYNKCADIILDVSNIDIDETLEKIKALIK
ncbi:MAG: shikimate kinase [Clostridia bacterium]|nr:shikimate kinase [Clostridia bacterium]